MTSKSRRVAVLGGTRFIGRAIVAELVRAGHEVLVIHLGVGGCDLFPSAAHLHTDRADLCTSATQVAAFDPQVVVDVSAMTAADVMAVIPVFESCTRAVVISSCDVYEAYLSFRQGAVAQTDPIDENSRLRQTRYVFPHAVPGKPDYDKLDVEEAWQAVASVVLRPTAVYGPHDYLAREAFVVDRVKAGRCILPAGPADLLYTKISSAELAVCARLAVTMEHVDPGTVINIAEPETLSTREWIDAVAGALGARIRLVRVPDAELPPDLSITGEHRQQLVINAERARAILGWQPRTVGAGIEASARWHFANRPLRLDFTDDERALAGRAMQRRR